VPVRIACRACGTGSDVDALPFACARCGTLDVDVIDGEQFQVVALELEEELVASPISQT
jgi:hydrogenase nickel incorporation protein HypA/HybF